MGNNLESNMNLQGKFNEKANINEKEQEIMDNIDPKNVYIPGSNYKVVDGALFRETIDGESGDIFETKVARNAPVTTARVTDIVTEETNYEVKWNTPDGIRTMTHKGEVLSKRNELLKLSNYGLSISEHNYKDVSRFIHDYEMEFFDKLPVTFITSSIGYVDNNITGEREFVLPYDDNSIKFNEDTKDKGSVDTYKSFEPKGTLEEYKESVFDKVKHGEVAMFGIFSSFASVLLEDFKTNSFVIDIAGSSGIGKTSTLKLCASVWGEPKEGGYIKTWNATPVYIENYTSFLNNFPVLLDETSTASNKQMLETTIYDFSQNSSKGRGSIEGTRETVKHNNILISTGEFPIIEREGIMKGATARVVTVTRQPFAYDEKLFNDIFIGRQATINNYYGTLGKSAYKEFKRNEDKYYDLHQELLLKYQELGQNNRVIRRLATSFAIIHIAGIIINDTLDSDVDVDHVIESIFNDIMKVENTLYNTNAKQLDGLLNYLVDNTGKHVRYYSENEKPYQDVWAYYEDEKQELYLLSTKVNNYLNNLNLHGGTVAKSIRQAWLEEGYVVAGETTTKDSRDGVGAKDTLRKRLPDGKQRRVIVVLKETLDSFDISFDKHEKDSAKSKFFERVQDGRIIETNKNGENDK